MGEPGVKLCESIKEDYFKVGGTLSLIYLSEWKMLKKKECNKVQKLSWEIN